MEVKILFADLDGTIIETKSGETFPKDADDWKFKDLILEAIASYAPTHLHIVSNQGGVEKGYITAIALKKKMHRIAGRLINLLPNVSVSFDYCTSLDANDKRRKPNTGMLEHFYNMPLYEKKDCLMIGDASGKEGDFSDSDKKCAENFGIDYMDVNDFIKAYGSTGS